PGARGRATAAARRAPAARVPRSRASPGRLQRSSLLDEVHRQEPEREAADVREDRDAARLVRMRDPDAALPRLQRDPDPQEPHRRDLAEDEEEDEGQHTRPRQEDEVRAEDAGDRPAGADVRNAGVTHSAEM